MCKIHGFSIFKSQIYIIQEEIIMKKLLIETGLIAFAGVVLVYIKKLKNDIHELEIVHQKEAGMIAQYSNEVNELKRRCDNCNWSRI